MRRDSLTPCSTSILAGVCLERITAARACLLAGGGYAESVHRSRAWNPKCLLRRCFKNPSGGFCSRSSPTANSGRLYASQAVSRTGSSSVAPVRPRTASAPRPSGSCPTRYRVAFAAAPSGPHPSPLEPLPVARRPVLPVAVQGIRPMASPPRGCRISGTSSSSGIARATRSAGHP